ncbi:MAG: DUF4271 domain-containing protein [Bacteroidales bacterium]
MFEGLPITYPYWKDYFLIILVAGLLAVLRAYYQNPRLFVRLLKSTFSKNETEKLRDDKQNTLSQRNAIILNLVFLVNLGMMMFLAIKYHSLSLPPHPEMINFLIVFSVIAGYYLIRIVLYHLVGFLTYAGEIQATYTQAWMGLNKWFGLLLFPAIAGMLYFPPEAGNIIIFLFAGLFVLLFLIKVYRGLQIAFANRISFIIIFLYLCALELLPVFVLLKYITGII